MPLREGVLALSCVATVWQSLNFLVEDGREIYLTTTLSTPFPKILDSAPDMDFFVLSYHEQRIKNKSVYYYYKCLAGHSCVQ